MNSAVTCIDGLLSRRTTIMILVKDHKIPVRQLPENKGSQADITKVISGFPPLPVVVPPPGTRTGKQASTAGLECAVPGHWDCGEPAAALERRQTSLLSWTLFFSRSLKGLRSGDMCGTAPGTGAEQVPRGGENPPRVYLLKPLSIALPDSSWQGRDHVSGRLQGI